MLLHRSSSAAYLAVPVISHVNDGAHLYQYIRQHTQTISIRDLQRSTAQHSQAARCFAWKCFLAFALLLLDSIKP
jgi:hypothetical protein